MSVVGVAWLVGQDGPVLDRARALEHVYFVEPVVVFAPSARRRVGRWWMVTWSSSAIPFKSRIARTTLEAGSDTPRGSWGVCCGSMMAGRC